MLQNIIARVVKMEKEEKMPCSAILEEYRVYVDDFQKFLEFYRGQHFGHRLLKYRKMTKELEQIKDKVRTLLALCSLETTGIIMDWKREWAANRDVQEQQITTLTDLTIRNAITLSSMHGVLQRTALQSEEKLDGKDQVTDIPIDRSENVTVAVSTKVAGSLQQTSQVADTEQWISCFQCHKLVPSDKASASTCADCYVQISNPAKEKCRQLQRRQNIAESEKTAQSPTVEDQSKVKPAQHRQEIVLRPRPKAPSDRSYVVDDWARCKPRGGTGYYALELAKFRKHMLPAKFALKCRSCNLEVVKGLFRGTFRPRNCRVCGELFCSECLVMILLPSPFGSGQELSCCFECPQALESKAIVTVQDIFTRRNERIKRFNPVIKQIRLPRDQVTLETLVNEGRYLELYKGVYKGQDVAISILPRTHYAGLGADKFLNDAIGASKLDHPSIVRLHGVSWNSLDDLCVVSEFVGGGNLRMLLSKFQKRGHPKGFTKAKVRIALQIAQALAFMHSLNISHDDVRPESVLLTDKRHAKLTAFHRCPTPKSRKNVDIWLAESLGHYPGDRRLAWKAPELLLPTMCLPLEFGKADMFAFGVLLSELDMHELTYESATLPLGAKSDEVYRLRMSGGLNPKFSERDTGAHYSRYIGTMAEVVTSLARACVSRSPNARPTAAKAVTTLERALRMPS
ncbi:putative serine/threonine-protein kinase/receptor [Phytophthora citrophthora]|uniref:Serine/threonine-protein kinase/receptor n=1 Tax=Phytophthora citrophthora TaxID=4793 RepID=A0AAD9G2F5_9STRA|nr:putative serine/threonine-protein kinase/receptor [Phytophthora citrophthora]